MGKTVGALQDLESSWSTRAHRLRLRRLVMAVVALIVLSHLFSLILLFGGNSYSLFDTTYESWPSMMGGGDQAVIDEETDEKNISATKSGGKKNKTLRSTTASIKKVFCPELSPKLVGLVKIAKHVPKLEELERAHPELKPGGHHKPEGCVSLHRVAIIIPYRDRESHLLALLHHLHPILQRQQIDYTFFVVEQAGKGKFNRGMLKNVGVLEAIRKRHYTCLIFHDVDLLPENDLNPYTCSPQPRHLSVGVNTFNYRLPYGDLFGGVAAISVVQFLAVNGFSNMYWGWGAEDDDLTRRLRNHNFHIERYSPILSRYTMLSHQKDTPNPERLKYLGLVDVMHMKDGLNSIRYNTLAVVKRPLFTWVYVDLLPS